MISEVAYEDFLNTLITECKAVKKIEDDLTKEEATKRYVEFVYPKITDSTKYKAFIKKFVDDGYWNDVWSDVELSDDGDDYEFYIMIGDKVFETIIHCEAEWVGDWSVRKNLVGKISLSKITEVKFELLSKTESSAEIKLI